MISSGNTCEITVLGSPTTGSSRSNKWRNELETEFSLVTPLFISEKPLSVRAKFWIKRHRFNGHRLDVDNLIKPVLDCVKKSGLIQDDSFVHNLEVSKIVTDGEESLELVLKELF